MQPPRISRGAVVVEGLELHAFHGCFAHEREHGQWFSIDLAIVADLAEAAASDKLSAAVDYGAAIAKVAEVFCGEPRNLVEAAAYDVARALLDGFPRIETVTVKVVKLAPPVAAKLRAAGVEIAVDRGA